MKNIFKSFILLSAACLTFSLSACKEEHKHNLTYVEALAPTCTEEGNTEYWACDGCELIFKDEEGKNLTTYKDVVLEPLGHSLSKVEAKEATCLEDGNIEYYTCSRCDALFKDAEGKVPTTLEEVTLTKLAHRLTKVEAKEPTCTEEGNKEYYTCSGCDLLFKDAEGKETTTLEEVTLAKLAHTLTKVEAKEATCLEDGNIEHYKCSVCNKLFNDDKASKELTAEEVKLSKHTVTHVEETKVSADNLTYQREYWHCEQCNKNYLDADLTIEATAEEVAPVTYAAYYAVSTLAELKTAVSTTENAYVELTADLDYAKEKPVVEYAVNVTKSVVIDGVNHTIKGSATRWEGQPIERKDTLVINANNTSKISVTIKNLNVFNDYVTGKIIETRGNVNALTIDNCDFKCTGKNNNQVITVGGNDENTLALTIKNTNLSANNDGYAIILFNPANIICENSNITAWTACYFKGINGSAGSNGSNTTFTNCHIVCNNDNPTPTNDFGAFSIEDKNLNITIIDCDIECLDLYEGEKKPAEQALFSINPGYVNAEDEGDVFYNFAIKGDSNVNGRLLLQNDLYNALYAKTVTKISGGTFTDALVKNYLETGYEATGNGPFVVSKIAK